MMSERPVRDAGEQFGNSSYIAVDAGKDFSYTQQ
jgi:hypothetical protein